MNTERPHRQGELDYHASRATREWDLGLLAANFSASRIHLSLVSLHMQRLRDPTTGLIRNRRGGSGSMLEVGSSRA
jgi:hypothetical protein